MEAVKNLYIREEKDTFSFDEIATEVRRIRRGFYENEVNVGLLLSIDFDYYYSYSGKMEDDSEKIRSISVKEDILDFDSMTARWEDILKHHAAGHPIPEPISVPVGAGVSSPEPLTLPSFLISDESLLAIVE